VKQEHLKGNQAKEAMIGLFIMSIMFVPGNKGQGRK
jgi:hypothetical protein